MLQVTTSGAAELLFFIFYLYVYKFGPGRYRPSAGPTRRAGGASEGQQRRELTATASGSQRRVLGLGAGHALSRRTFRVAPRYVRPPVEDRAVGQHQLLQ